MGFADFVNTNGLCGREKGCGLGKNTKKVENFWKNSKLFSKTPLKNVKKYNIMVVIIGSLWKGYVFWKRRETKVTFHAPNLPIKYTHKQGDFYYEHKF